MRVAGRYAFDSYLRKFHMVYWLFSSLITPLVALHA